MVHVILENFLEVKDTVEDNVDDIQRWPQCHYAHCLLQCSNVLSLQERAFFERNWLTTALQLDSILKTTLFNNPNN